MLLQRSSLLGNLNMSVFEKVIVF